MDWGNFFKKAGAVVGSVAVRAGASVLMSKGTKAQGRDFVDGVIGGLVFGRRDPLTTDEVFSMAVSYAASSLRGQALVAGVQHARDRTYGGSPMVTLERDF